MASADQTWVVTQDAKTFTVEKTFPGGEQPMPSQKSNVQSGRQRDDSGDDRTHARQSRAESKVAWGWKILELNSVLKTNIQGNDVTITTTEHWELADGGKTLKVHRTQEARAERRKPSWYSPKSRSELSYCAFELGVLKLACSLLMPRSHRS